MTKKHFIALADVVRERYTTLDDSQREGVVAARYELEAVIYALADFCSQQNPRFNRSRWMDYVHGKCGPNGGAVRKQERAA